MPTHPLVMAQLSGPDRIRESGHRVHGGVHGVGGADDPEADVTRRARLVSGVGLAMREPAAVGDGLRQGGEPATARVLAVLLDRPIRVQVALADVAHGVGDDPLRADARLGSGILRSGLNHEVVDAHVLSGHNHVIRLGVAETGGAVDVRSEADPVHEVEAGAVLDELAHVLGLSF